MFASLIPATEKQTLFCYLRGHWNKTLDEGTTLLTKLTKLATELGLPTLKELGYAGKLAFQEQKLEVLRTHP